MTPLHLAAEDGEKPRVIRPLVGVGAGPNAQDVRGHTPLHTAAMFQSREEDQRLADIALMFNLMAIDELLRAGADPSVKDADGNFPWDYAKDREDLKDDDRNVYWRLNEGRF